MKDFNPMVFVTGLFITAVIGLIVLLLLENLTFSGLCMVAAAILYSCSLEKTDQPKKDGKE